MKHCNETHCIRVLFSAVKQHQFLILLSNRIETFVGESDDIKYSFKKEKGLKRKVRLSHKKIKYQCTNKDGYSKGENRILNEKACQVFKN